MPGDAGSQDWLASAPERTAEPASSHRRTQLSRRCTRSRDRPGQVTCANRLALQSARPAFLPLSRTVLSTPAAVAPDQGWQREPPSTRPCPAWTACTRGPLHAGCAATEAAGGSTHPDMNMNVRHAWRALTGRQDHGDFTKNGAAVDRGPGLGGDVAAGSAGGALSIGLAPTIPLPLRVGERPRLRERLRDQRAGRCRLPGREHSRRSGSAGLGPSTGRPARSPACRPQPPAGRPALRISVQSGGCLKRVCREELLCQPARRSDRLERGCGGEQPRPDEPGADSIDLSDLWPDPDDEPWQASRRTSPRGSLATRLGESTGWRGRASLAWLGPEKAEAALQTLKRNLPPTTFSELAAAAPQLQTWLARYVVKRNFIPLN